MFYSDKLDFDTLAKVIFRIIILNNILILVTVLKSYDSFNSVLMTRATLSTTTKDDILNPILIGYFGSLRYKKSFVERGLFI